MIPKSPPACIYFLRWVENFSNLRNVKSRTDYGNPPVSKQTVQTVKSYLRNYPTRSLRITYADLKISYIILQNIMKKLDHIFPYKIIGENQLKTRFCTKSCLLSILYVNHVVQFRFLMSNHFLLLICL